MKQLLTLLCLTLLLTACSVARGSGDIITEEFSVERAFTELDITMSGNVTVIQGETPQITVTGDDNIVELLEADFNGDRLRFKFPTGTRIEPSQSIEIEIVMTDIEAFNISGSADLAIGDLETDDLKVDVSGSGSIMIGEMVADSFDGDISGSGEITVAGQVDSAEFDISGSGEVNARQLVAADVEIDISGSGEASVWSTDKLDVSISGSGDVTYGGSASAITQDVSGSGDIRFEGGR